MTINLNAEPYNDDYDETKNFYKILFRPSYPVQARELTQLQTILQKQISRHGNHVFKQGAMVVPGQISYDNNAQYVKLQSTYNGISVESILPYISGQTVVGSSGLTALIVAVRNTIDADPTTIYIRYTNSGTDTTVKVFADNEVLTCTVGSTTYSFQAQGSSATGLGSIVSIETGIYYVNEYFALVEAQSLIIEPYSQTPSYKIGLKISEELITPENDESLLDNALGSYNYSAPGAHRYYIGLILSTLSVTATDTTNFIELMQVDAGVLRKLVSTTEYSILEKTLARRTYDESGDYTVKEFKIDIREHRNNNRGAWASGQTYQYGDIVTNDNKTYTAKSIAPTTSLTNVPPTHTTAADAYDGTGVTGVLWEYNLSPFYNRGINLDGDESKLAIGIEPGKAYVKGYEIEKIVTEYLPISKSRTLATVADSVVSSNVGNIVYVTNIFNLPPVDTLGTIQLHDRLSSTLSGTVTVTLGSTALTATGAPKFSTELTIGSVIRNLGGLYVGTVTAIASDSAATITAAAVALAGVTTAVVFLGVKIGTARTRLLEWDSGAVGSSAATYKLSLFDIKMNNGYTFNDNVKSFYSATVPFIAEIKPILIPKAGTLNVVSGVVTAITDTAFTTDLTVGDYISVSSVGSSAILRVTGSLSATQFTTNVTAPYSNATYSVVRTFINESDEDTLIFPLPLQNIQTVRDSNGNHKLNYTVYEKLTATVAGSATSFSVSTTSPNAMISGENNSNYIISRTDSGAVIIPSNITASGNTTTFVLPALLSTSPVTCTVICASIRTGSSSLEKIKTVTLAAVRTVATQADATAQVIYLEQADCYRIKSIMMRTGYTAGLPFTTSGTGNYTVDITGNYDFDTGQRKTHYDLGSISLKAGFLPATDCFKITYEYFSHSVGDYCTVNSYSTALPFEGIQTNDYIDFRPVISSSGLFTSVAVPKRGYDVKLDFKYYLAVKEKIAIDLYGKVFNVEGSPAILPASPEDPSNGMVIYNLTLSPFTYDTTKDSILVEKTDNKRYTMRDIGKLEKRIDTIEYYTSLSLLEQETQSLKITDSSGLDRLKNGFIVDNFSGHGIGDVTSVDYACSIDMEENQLRPSAYVTNVNMVEKLTTDAQRLAQHYGLYGDVITLPIIDHIPLVKQGFASRLENINPFAVFTFIGDVKITPSSDDWFEIKRLPDVVTDVEGNFNTIKAASSGILGTVWNSWQTVWTGKPVSKDTVYTADKRVKTGLTFDTKDKNGIVTTHKVTNTVDELDDLFGIGADPEGGGWARRKVTVTNSKTQVGQARTGVNTKLVTKIDRQVVADRVVSTAVIPYIRSRNILVQVRGLKPSTRFYPYFDDVKIDTYCTPASKMTYTLTSGTRNFSAEINSGGNAAVPGRKIGTDAQVCLNKGDLITGSISGATAVVVGVEINGNVRKLHLSNIKGTFGVETITGSVLYPGGYATGTIAAGAVTTSAKGSSLTTNLNGDLNLLFEIPNTEIVRFRTGSREFKLIDATVATAPYTSRGITSYRAEGIIESKQASINAVRNAELVQTGTSQTKTITQTSERIVDTGWYDPLAQSFLVENKGGAFLTKVDVFFATKDSAIPVTIQIREMVNGYPGNRILPFSKVTLKPEDVVLSANTVALPDDVLYPTFDTPTTFKFPSPVYVEDATNYCIVLVSDSNNYKVWISQLGDDIPGTPNGKISEQPYAGVLFKSQNASTWTADQMQDLKFTIYKAKFDISYANGSDVEFVNDSLPYSTLETDPIQLITGSTVARIWHNNHGLNVGDKIDMQGISSSLGGIATTLFNKTHLVQSVELDSYIINGLTVATSTGYFGGSSVLVSTNVKYVTIQPQAQVQNFSDTNVNYSVTPYVDGVNDPVIPVVVNDNNTFTETRSIKSEILISDPKTLTFTANLKSTNDSLSPVLDTHRMSVTAVNNVINYPTYDVTTLTPVDYSEVFTNSTGAFTFNPLSVAAGSFVIGTSYKIVYAGDTVFTSIGATNNTVGTVFIAKGVGVGTGTAATSSILTSTASAVRSLMANILPGQYIKTIAATANTTNNGGVFLVTNYSDNGTTATLTVKDSSVYNKIFVNETSSAGALTVASYTGNGTTTVTAVVATSEGLNVGDTIVISGATGTEQTKLNGTWLISSLPAGGSSFTFVVATAVAIGSLTTSLGTINRPIKVSIVNLFNNEIISNGSSSAAKYVSMPVSLALPSTSVKLKFAVNNPSVSVVNVYYKSSLGSTVNIDTLKYNYVDPTVAAITVQNGNDTFYDVDYNFTLNAFDTIQIKLVMNSVDTSAVPKIKDFRIIALA